MGITDRILTIEQSAEAAWPALREETLEGWRLRFADGFTRRSNSVQPFQLEGRQGGEALDGHPSMEGVKEGHEALVGRIAACEAAYHAMDQPAIFRILPPLDTNGLADVLSGRGYRREGETVVMTREFLPEYSVKDGKVTAFEDPLSGAALAALIRLTHTPERHQGTFAALLKRGSPPRTTAHTAALLSQGEEIICCGRGVVAAGRLGVFDVATDPGRRRQGLATLLVAGLMDWGRIQGATEAYLQVEADNKEAMRLYRRLGFSELYRYGYWARRG